MNQETKIKLIRIEQFTEKQDLDGLVLMGTEAYWQQTMIGLVIVIAVIVNVQIVKQRSA